MTSRLEVWMRTAFGIVRLAAAGVGIIALIARLNYSLGFAGSAVANYFSYFTTQSAIAATILWLIAGFITLRYREDPAWMVTTRLFVTTYQIASGTVFAMIVAGAAASDYRLVVPVSDQVLHYWLPAYAVLDWLLAPGRPRAKWRSLGTVLIYPVIWGMFTMSRGAFVGWYPYFFLDPTQVTWPTEFLVYAVGVMAFIVAVATTLTVTGFFLPSLLSQRQGDRAEAISIGRADSPISH